MCLERLRVVKRILKEVKAKLKLKHFRKRTDSGYAAENGG
jgi:hypothetical protein